MKTYKEFIKEINHVQEKLDATVYGQLRLGSKPPVVTNQSIKRGVDSAIKNMGTGKPSLSTSEKRGSYGLSGSGYVRLGYSSGSTPTKTKPTPTRIRPTLNKGTQTPNRTLTKSPSSGMNPITKRISDYRMSTM